MSRRDAQQGALYLDPEEVYEDQPTRAERPSMFDPDEATRAPRESYVALSELPQLRELPKTPSAPSYEDSPTRIGPARISYVASVELGRAFDEEVTSFVDRSSMIAASEIEEQAGPESVTTYALRSPSSYATSEIQEVDDQSAEEHYEALSRYLFDDVAPMNELPPPPPEAELYADERPRPILATRRSRYSIHDVQELHDERPVHSFRPPPPIAHHAYDVAPFQPPMSSRRSMPSMHPHDASAEKVWVIPSAPSTRRGARMAAPARFELTPSVLAAVLVGLLALTVMVAGIVFVRSDDRASTSARPVATYTTVQAAPAETATTMVHSTAVPAAAPPSVIVISSDDVMPAAEAPAPTQIAPPSIEPKPAVAAPVAKPAFPQAADRAPAPAKKPDGKLGSKSVEDILNELGEEQLRR